MTDLNKPFIFVDDTDIETFDNEKDNYTNQIAFLGSTGKIVTKGKYYGGKIDTSEIVSLLKEKLVFELDDDSNLVVKLDGTLISTVELITGSVPCKSITVEDTTVNIVKDGTKQIVTTILPQNTTDEVIYSTSNADVATVSDDGLITWKSGGEVTITINCGRKELQITVNCDKLLNTTYSVKNDSWTLVGSLHSNNTITNDTVILADETIINHDWDEVTTEQWSISGNVNDEYAGISSHTIEANTTVTVREIELSDTTSHSNETLNKTITQHYLTLLPATVEMNCTNTFANFGIKQNAANGGAGYNDRRTIATLYNSNSPTYYKACNGITGVLKYNYDGIYIPANTTNLKITWNSDNNNWYFAANLFTMNDVRTNNNTMLTRVKDAGWNYNTGVWEFDTSSYKEGLYLFGNFAWANTRDQIAEDKCNSMTWENINFNIELTQEQNWNYFRGIKNSIKVNKTTGEYATDEEIAANTNVDNTGRQGGETFNGKYYQFYDREGGYLIYDVNEKTEPEHHTLVCDPLLHWGSVCFSNIYSYTKDGTETTVTTPLVFATGHYVPSASISKVEIVDVVDIENDVLVKQYKFENRKDDIICAWDFENNKCWAIGYEPVSGYATGNWYIDEYEIEDFVDPTNTKKTRVDQYYINGTANNTLQDVKYKNGYLYLATGWGSTHGQTVTVWKISTTTKDVIGRTVSSIATNKEAEGLALMGDYMIVTNDSEMYKVKYNFDIYRLTSYKSLTTTADPLDATTEPETPTVSEDYLNEHQVYSLPSNSTVFNGVDTYVDTGYKLFDTDKSFSFIIDFETDTTQPSGQSNRNTTIVSCFNDSTNGANLDIMGYNPDKEDSTNTSICNRILFFKPTGFTFGTTGALTKSYNFNKNILHSRQKILMSYNAETKTVNAYILYSYDGTVNTYTATATDDYTFTALNYNVVLGCRHVNTTYDRYWKGIIYDFKIYDVALPNILTNTWNANEGTLNTLGCVKLDEVKETYPNIMSSVNGETGLYFSKNTAGNGCVIQTGVTPLYTDTIEIKFKTTDLTSNIKTLYCTRSNGTAGNSFTTFIVSNAIRADYDNPSTTDDTKRYELTANTPYIYSRTKDGDSMNGSYPKAFKNTSTGEYTASHPLVIGASTSSVTGYADSTNRPSVSNYLTDMIIYSLSIKNSDGEYTAYLVACEDNKMVDLVTGNVITAATVNNQNQALNELLYQ